MKKYKNVLIFINLALLLVYINWTIFSKESTLKTGRLVLLELAPADPRSLMQGDYMQLRYKLTATTNFENMPRRGYCLVSCDEMNVASRPRYSSRLPARDSSDIPIRYFYNEYGISLGAESYFFEEGQAEKFARAKFGGLRVDAAGNSVLQGLYDRDHQLIKP